MNELEEAKELSNTRIKDLRSKFEKGIHNKDICVFACGSLGRLEITDTSDLDLFFILMDDTTGKEREISNIDKYRFFSKIYDINHEMGFQDPSKGGFYWDFITECRLLDIGSRIEDFNNSFTARMLLMLEAKPLHNTEAYLQLKKLQISTINNNNIFLEYREFYKLY